MRLSRESPEEETVTAAVRWHSLVLMLDKNKEECTDKLTRRSLINQAGKALCSWRVRRRVAAGATQLLQLQQQLIHLRHLHLDDNMHPSENGNSDRNICKSRIKWWNVDSRCEVTNTHIPLADKPSGTGSMSLPSASGETLYVSIKKRFHLTLTWDIIYML